MAGRAAWSLLFLLISASLLLRSPLLFLLTALAVVVIGASALWERYCLANVTYRRRFGAERLVCGEETDLWVEIANAKPLPLAWVKIADEFPNEFAVRGISLGRSGQGKRRLLTNILSMRWYERVRRHYWLVARRRGAFDFGPVTLSSGDLFGFRTRSEDIAHKQTVLVYPKLVPLEHLGLRPARPMGEFRAARRVVADPLRMAGARDYQPGDNVRHVHWKATARRGVLQTKVFDPSASPHLVICLNSHTFERAYEGVISDYLETAIVVAASIAHAGLETRHPVGLFTNGVVRDTERRLRLPASRHRSQNIRILEALAQMTYFAYMSFESLLRLEAPHLPYGATVIAVSAVVSEPILSALLDLRAAGHPVALVAVGGHALPNLPPGLPVYAVTENWTEMESLSLPG